MGRFVPRPGRGGWRRCSGTKEAVRGGRAGRMGRTETKHGGRGKGMRYPGSCMRRTCDGFLRGGGEGTAEDAS
eukprot:scaffold741_cov336-Pavlova_lutheri.AAC.50